LVKKKVAVLVASAKRPPEAEEGKVKESPSDGEQSE
jgi:hypothetical protein